MITAPSTTGGARKEPSLYVTISALGGTSPPLGTNLRIGESAGKVHLDWSMVPVDGNVYVVRRKEIVDSDDSSFEGSLKLATVSDPIQTYDDAVLGDTTDYDYEVFLEVRDEEVYFYHADHLGAPVAMTGATGALVWRSVLGPFGEVVDPGVTLVENTLLFPGQYRDTESGLAQNYFRDFDPVSGRYREPDPLGLRGGHLYTYARNNPVNYIDSRGLQPILRRYKGPGTGARIDDHPHKEEIEKYRETYDRWLAERRSEGVSSALSLRWGCFNAARNARFHFQRTEHCINNIYSMGPGGRLVGWDEALPIIHYKIVIECQKDNSSPYYPVEFIDPWADLWSLTRRFPWLLGY